jgi:hypothetical protein
MLVMSVSFRGEHVWGLGMPRWRGLVAGAGLLWPLTQSLWPTPWRILGQILAAVPVVVVINNDGYTVEWAIHGESAYYNDPPTTKLIQARNGPMPGQRREGHPGRAQPCPLRSRSDEWRQLTARYLGPDLRDSWLE